MSTLQPDAMPIPPAFTSLLEAFSAFVGFAGATKDTLGLEFEAGHHTVRVMPHPGQTDWLIVEVDVIEVEAASLATHTAIHRINHAARLEHGWLASMDADAMLVMHTLRPITALTAPDLEGLLVDGLERAEALAHLWRDTDQVEENSPSSATDASGGKLPHFAFIRG